MLFTMRLAQIKLSQDPRNEELFDYFLKPQTAMEPSILSLSLLDGKLSPRQVAELEDISLCPHFNGLKDDLEQNPDKWLLFLNDTGSPESIMSEPWRTESDLSVTSDIARLLKKLILIRVLRPDRLLSVAR